MKPDRAINRFVQLWVNNMIKITPVGKRPRTEAAEKLYSDPLKESIKKIDGGKPIIQMNLYGTFVNSGHRTRGTTKVPPNRFIDKSFDETVSQMEDKLPSEVFQIVENQFDSVLNKYRTIG